MNWPIQPMTQAEYAALQQQQGQKITRVGDVFWRQVRPFFYRPLLPFLDYPVSSRKAPWPSILGGFQHGVANPVEANSSLKMLIFERPQDYRLEALDRHERREIRRAAGTFTLSFISDAQEFIDKGHPLYLSFYERTRYEYKSNRQEKRHFARWVQSLYGNSKTLFMGAYKENELRAVAVWNLVEENLVYSVFFCDRESLKMHVAGLILHEMCQAAAQRHDIRQIFIGMQKVGPGAGIDSFYLERGCSLVEKPAVLHVNPLAALLLRRFLPAYYSRLQGVFIASGPGNIAEKTETKASFPAEHDRAPQSATANHLAQRKAGEQL